MNRQFFDDYCSGNIVVMPRPRFIEEHKKLLQVLERKNPRELEKEKKEQEKELKSYLKKHATSSPRGSKE